MNELLIKSRRGNNKIKNEFLMNLFANKKNVCTMWLIYMPIIYINNIV